MRPDDAHAGTTTRDEGEWLVALGRDDKGAFLAALGHALTIAGRSAYAVGGDGLNQPERLRRINEIQHRVLACLQQTLAGTGDAGFERSIAAWVLDQPESDLHQLMRWAWSCAKRGTERREAD